MLFVVANGGTLLASWLLAKYPFASAPLHLRLLGVVAGFSALAIPLLTLLGIAHSLNAVGIAIGAALVVVAVVALVLVRKRSSETRPPPASPAKAPERERAPTWQTGAGVGLLVAMAIPVLDHHLMQAMNFKADDLSYHATMSAHWLQREAFFLAPYDYHAYFPANAELFPAFFVAPTRVDAFGALAGLYWMVLGAIAAHALARELGIRAPLSLLAPAIMLSSPPFDDQAAAYAATDLAAGVLACAGAAFAVGVNRDTLGPELRVRAGYSGALMGLAAGTKITFMPLAALTLLYFALASDRTARRTYIENIALFAMLCTLTSSYWYVRNLVLTGNPAFPAEVAFFDGPLDRAAQTKTALSTQLALLDGPALSEALNKLFDWPKPIFYFLGAGYAVTILHTLLDALRRKGIGWPLVWVATLGLTSLFLVVFGPFSGTANSADAPLQIRLRFFLGFALLGIVLATYWLSRIPRVSLAVSLLAMAGVLVLFEGSLAFGVLSVLGGGLIGLGAPRARRWFEPYVPSYGRRAAPLVPAVVSLGISVWLFVHFSHKEVLDRAERDAQMQRWLAVEALPAGTRVTWITRFRSWQYYGMFGRRLQLVPYRIDRDGSVDRPLHLDWRTTRPTWWAPAVRKKIGRDFVERLREQGLQAVLFFRKTKKARWGRRYQLVERSPHAKLIHKDERSVLFALDVAR